MKVKDIRQNSIDFAAEIADRTGTDVVAYSRSPIGENETFVMSVDQANPSRIRLWAGVANIEVKDASKKDGQAVVWVTENEHDVERTMVINVSRRDVPNLVAKSYDEQDRPSFAVHENWKTFLNEAVTGQRVAERNFPIVMPPGTTYTTEPDITLTQKREIERQVRNIYSPSWYVNVNMKITAHAPTVVQHLLVGRDESASFISALPVAAKTITGAHRSLRPAGLGKGTIRQGEWFFTPADASVSEGIEKKIKREHDWGGRIALRSLERHSVHYGVTTDYKYKMYATGPVYDVRPASRHKSLNLVGWHLVTRNTEIIDPNSNSNQRYWD